MACKGAEKAFVAFAERIGKAWQDEASRATYGDDWFRSAVARVILFRATEGLVGRAAWYASGTRAQVVAYSTAKLANMAKEHSEGGQLDYLRVWSRQEAGDLILELLGLIAEKVMAILLDPPQAGWNVGEWAKQQACRNRVLSTEIETIDGFDALLIDRADKLADKRAQREQQRVTEGLEVMQEVIALGADYWTRLREVARKNRLLSPDDEKAFAAAVAIPRRVPTEFQAARVVAVRRRAEEAGYFTAATPLRSP
jgi:hypothetical protein